MELLANEWKVGQHRIPTDSELDGWCRLIPDPDSRLNRVWHAFASMMHLVPEPNGIMVPVPFRKDSLANICAAHMAKTLTIKQLLWVSLKSGVPLTVLELIANALGNYCMWNTIRTHCESCMICTASSCHGGSEGHVHEYTMPEFHMRSLTFHYSTWRKHPQRERFICGHCGGTMKTGCRPAPWTPARPAPPATPE